MHRKFFCCGNWKMNVLMVEIDELLDNLKKKVAGIEVDLVIAPPAIYLEYTKRELPSHFQLGAQNCYKYKTGDFTGEHSPTMLLELGVTWVILGQAERRYLFNESDELIAEKVHFATSEGLNCVVCIGETIEEREEGQTADVIMNQLQYIIDAVSLWDRIVIAYEPVWAIGTGITPTLPQIQEVHKLIRKVISEKVGAEPSRLIRLIYGGSVNSGNCKDINKQRDVDGFLVSTASLAPEFADICNIGF